MKKPTQAIFISLSIKEEYEQARREEGTKREKKLTQDEFIKILLTKNGD